MTTRKELQCQSYYRVDCMHCEYNKYSTVNAIEIELNDIKDKMASDLWKTIYSLLIHDEWTNWYFP